MGDAPRYKTLRDYVRVLRERRWLVVFFTVLLAAASYVIWSSAEPVYRAEASVTCTDVLFDENILGGNAAPRRTPEAEAALCAEDVTSPEVARAVRRDLELESASLGSLTGAVAVRREASTGLVILQAESSSAAFAARLANAFAEQTARVRTAAERARLDRAVRTLRRRFAQQKVASKVPVSVAFFEERVARLESLANFAQPVDVVSRASVPGSPVSPNVGRDTILGALLGLTLGIVAAFVRDALDRKLRSLDRIKAEVELPMLASVSADSLGGPGPFGSKVLQPADLEAYRILRANLDFTAGKPVRSVAITSAVAEEGKSSVALGLAWAYATAGRSTLLVDCDLRRGDIAERLGLPPAPGLTDYLLEKAALPDILRAVPLPGASPNGAGADREQSRPRLTLIPAGSLSEGPAELLESSEFKDFLAVVSRSYERVVLDTSPLLPVADTLELLGIVEGVVVCVRASRTTREQASAARSVVSRYPDSTVGLVVTGAPADDQAGYGYYEPATTAS